jgi:hypothetical protein
LLGVDDGNPANETIYNRIRSIFPELNLLSFYQTRQQIRRVAALTPTIVPMCPNSCQAFPTAQQADDAKRDGCPTCHTNVFTADGKHPILTFDYIPLLPRLAALYQNPARSEVMQSYRALYQPNPTKMRDIFDGSLYKELCTQPAIFKGHHLNHNHFSRSTDVALGLWADGFQLFKRGSHDCWPLLIVNYNLPPKDRFRKENVWLVGIIPGPRGPKDLNSFLEPLIDELGVLMKGVRHIWDSFQRKYVTIGAYLIIVSGDMPAVAKLMNFKGHRGMSPCRVCRLLGCLCENQYYYPLETPAEWNRRSTLRALREDGPDYDPSALPLRNHSDYLDHISDIARATNLSDTQRAYGITGPSILSSVSSIDFPRSFPLGFAHLVSLNTVPNLMRHGLGTFNQNVPNTGEPYAIPPDMWDRLTQQLSNATATVPATFGRHFRNMKNEMGLMVAEDWINFLLYASRPFFATIYMDNGSMDCLTLWTCLAEAAEECLLLEFPTEAVQSVRAKFAQFVLLYEEYAIFHHCMTKESNST